MPNQSLATLATDTIGVDMASQSWSTSANGLPVFDQYGGHMENPPLAMVKVENMDEFPPRLGNYFVNLEIKVIGPMDPDNSQTFRDNVDTHLTNVGNVFDYLGSLSPAQLNDPNSAQDSLHVDMVEIGEQSSEIDIQNDVLEDTFELKLYCHIIGPNG